MHTLIRRSAGAVAALFIVLSAASAGAHALNGTWDLVSKGGPHGDMRFQVTFTHGEGTALVAEMTLFDNKIAMSGEAKDGAFTLTGQSGASTLTMTGKLKADGTLEGFLSNEQGDLLWTGTRAK